MSETAIAGVLNSFIAQIKTKTNTLLQGEPEEQLRIPFVNCITAIATALGYKISCIGEVLLENQVGKPDYAVLNNNLLVGYVELKAPGKGADTSRYKGHDSQQAFRFANLPNVLYCDGYDWGLYRNGVLAESIVHLFPPPSSRTKKDAPQQSTSAIRQLLTNFLSWEPIVPENVLSISKLIAPLCRMLRNNVEDAMKVEDSPLVQLAMEWRQLLFPDASDEQFADAYAQTVTFALLLAKSEKDGPIDIESAITTLKADHSLLSRALQILTEDDAKKGIKAPIDTLLRIISAISHQALKSSNNQEDPWLFFYEQFLSLYDPELRKNAGVYYTPIQVVHAQVRLIDDLLANKFSKPLGFADPTVTTIDPAAGTGTYLLGVIEQALNNVKKAQGEGAVPTRATELAKNLYGFEKMAGPFAVSELRINRAITDRGATIQKGQNIIYLTDTLESPHTKPKELPSFYKPITDQHRKALEIKTAVPILVCIGNPPYDRNVAGNEANIATTGNWVRWGDIVTDYTPKSSKKAIISENKKHKISNKNEKPTRARPILSDFIEPVSLAGYGLHIKNLYNQYVYFWRWAIYKVFESNSITGQGIISFITPSSYLDGPAFCGMRQYIRQQCDEVWILDLGGDSRGTQKTENIFAIQIPIAIGIAIRYKKQNTDSPARIKYANIDGTREEKLVLLEQIKNFKSLKWLECPKDWLAPFRPKETGAYFTMPLLTDVMPWQHSGIQFKRTWPIAPTQQALKSRWKSLLIAKNRKEAFRETDRTIDKHYPPLPGHIKSKPIAKLSVEAPPPPIEHYAFRSFDRQWILADSRLCDRVRPALWVAHSNRQLYLTSIFTELLGNGPAIVASALIPDTNCFSGRGGKDVVPLYRDPECKNPNILPELLPLLAKTYNHKVTPEQLLAYIYGTMAHPDFTNHFAKELSTKELRVPLTKNPKLFSHAVKIGENLLWLHTFAQRYAVKGRDSKQVPVGLAKCRKAVPSGIEKYPEKYGYDPALKTLYVGEGQFAPVPLEVYEYEVSGLKVVQSWLGYRMKNPTGKKSSPLNDITTSTLTGWPSDFTTELLELLWVLEKTVEQYSAQKKLLKTILTKSCFQANDLPSVPENLRKPLERNADEKEKTRILPDSE